MNCLYVLKVEQLRAELEDIEGKHEDTQEQLRQEITELQQQANAGKRSRRGIYFVYFIQNLPSTCFSINNRKYLHSIKIYLIL